MNLFHTLKKELCILWSHRTAALIAAVTMLLTSTAATETASALYILTGAEDSAIILDGTTKVPAVTSSMVNLSTGSRTADIRLNADQTVIIRRNNTSLIAQSKSESVSRLLDRLDIVLSPFEMVAVDISGQQVEITIDEEIVYYDRVEEPAAPETIRVANPEMTAGTEKVVQEGIEGVRTSVYEVIWSNGEQISHQLVEELDSTAVDTVIEYGTAPQGPEPVAEVITNPDGSGTLVLESGATLEFSGSKAMTATAYTAGHGGAGYITALGTDLPVGVVAVDKKVIPLRTKVYVVTKGGIVYGPAVAEDTGVRGNVIDLYMDTYDECMTFGRRGCTVYILK